MRQKDTNEIICELFADDVVGKIIRNVAKNADDPDLKDLEQDIYESLLTKDKGILQDLYKKGQLKFYITRMAINNINSRTSRYYYNYKKNNMKNIPLDDWYETAGDFD